MDLDPGYGMATAQVKRLCVLDDIYSAADGQAGRNVALTDQFERCEPETEDALLADLQYLEEERLIKLWLVNKLSASECALTPGGVDLIAEVRRSRDDQRQRRTVVRDAVLQWAYDCNASGEGHVAIDSFLQSPLSVFLGTVFTATEIRQATKWLHDRGYITGPIAAGGVVVKPAITTSGELTVESGRSVNDQTTPDSTAPVGINISNSSNVNVAASSPGANQANTLTSNQRQQLLQVADAFEKVLPLLGLDSVSDEHQARQVIDELRQVGQEEEPDRSRLRNILGKVRELATKGTEAAVGGAVGALAKDAVNML